MKKMIVLSINLLISLLIPTTALAIDVDQVTLHAVVQIQSGSNRCSGVIVSPQGHLLTVKHCIDKRGRIKATLHNGDKTRGSLIYQSGSQDLVLAKLDTERLSQPLSHLNIAAQKPAHHSDIASLGYPQAHEKRGETPLKVTYGKVFAAELSYYPSINAYSKSSMSRVPTVLANVVVHTAQVIPGDSGGALINANQELIGITIGHANGLQKNGNYSIAYLAAKLQPILDIETQGAADGFQARLQWVLDSIRQNAATLDGCKDCLAKLQQEILTTCEQRVANGETEQRVYQWAYVTFLTKSLVVISKDNTQTAHPKIDDNQFEQVAKNHLDPTIYH